jgi:hypothetical protein
MPPPRDGFGEPETLAGGRALASALESEPQRDSAAKAHKPPGAFFPAMEHGPVLMMVAALS